jgi:hypothetical protein
MVEEWSGGQTDQVKEEHPLLLGSLLCEDAASSVALGDNRVSLQRIFFVLYADGFPAGYDRLVTANFWLGESKGEFEETVRITSPDGTVVAEGNSQLIVNADPVTQTQLFYFPGLTLPEPGQYTVAVLLDDTLVHEHTLRVVDVSEDLEEDDVPDTTLTED